MQESMDDSRGMKHQTAAILVIGNEILSGRTREANAHLAAVRLFECGCKVGEIAVVPDISSRIIHALNRLRQAYHAVITSGGIGPTHDDITMHAITEAFGVTLAEHPETLKTMARHYGADKINPGRRRMAMLPDGAQPIVSEKSIAPGAHIGNVYVLAGVPDIFASQLEAILPHFGGRPYQRREIGVALPESSFAGDLERLQTQFPQVEIGSYPSQCGRESHGKICLSSQDAAQLDRAEAALNRMLASLN